METKYQSYDDITLANVIREAYPSKLVSPLVADLIMGYKGHNPKSSKVQLVLMYANNLKNSRKSEYLIELCKRVTSGGTS